MLSGIVIARVPNTREQPFTHKLQIECVCEVKKANIYTSISMVYALSVTLDCYSAGVAT